ncbi:MAG: hypothetical protein AB1938_15770 [Myxococcota bacterium]
MTPPTVRFSQVRLVVFALASIVSGVAAGDDRDPGPFVPPEATKRLASGVRQLSANVDEEHFRGDITSPRILIDNPYVDPSDPFFGIPRQMACLSDGSLAVFANAKKHLRGYMKGNPYAIGLWRIAPDGAITAIDRARPTWGEGRDLPGCGVTIGHTGILPEWVGPMSVAADGSLVFPSQARWADGRNGTVLRVTIPDGAVEPVPNDPAACKTAPPESVKTRFEDVASAVRDPDGNTWIRDRARCELLRVDPGGGVTTVLGRDKLCPKGQPENHVSGEFMQWDASRGELVSSGSYIATKPRDVFSTIWRIRPDGTLRRVYLARKVGAPPRVDGISGLTVDGKGTIFFGAGLLSSGGGYQILKLVDEAKGRTQVVAGAPRPTDVNHGDGPALKAHFGTVRGLCFTKDGTLYVHDANHLIRKISPAGQVTTWAF